MQSRDLSSNTADSGIRTNLLGVDLLAGMFHSSPPLPQDKHTLYKPIPVKPSVYNVPVTALDFPSCWVTSLQYNITLPCYKALYQRSAEKHRHCAQEAIQEKEKSCYIFVATSSTCYIATLLPHTVNLLHPAANPNIRSKLLKKSHASTKY